MSSVCESIVLPHTKSKQHASSSPAVISTARALANSWCACMQMRQSNQNATLLAIHLQVLLAEDLWQLEVYINQGIKWSMYFFKKFYNEIHVYVSKARRTPQLKIPIHFDLVKFPHPKSLRKQALVWSGGSLCFLLSWLPMTQLGLFSLHKQSRASTWNLGYKYNQIHVYQLY